MISCIVILVVVVLEIEEAEDWDGSIRSESNLQIDIGYSPDSTLCQKGGRCISLEKDKHILDMLTSYAHTIKKHTSHAHKYTNITKLT